VQVGFISANPTGPIHVGNGWWGSYGDSLARVVGPSRLPGQPRVLRQDTGGQIRTLGESLLARRHGQEVGEGGYQGEYVTELADSYAGPDDVTRGRSLGGRPDPRTASGPLWPRWASCSTSGTARHPSRRAVPVDETIGLLADKGLVFRAGWCHLVPCHRTG